MALDLVSLEAKVPRIVKHLLFWVVYLAFFSILWGSFEGNFLSEFLWQLLHLPEKIIPTYITLYWLLPNFLLKHKYISFFVYLTILMLLMGFMGWVMAVYIEQPLFYPRQNYGSIFQILKIVKVATGIYPVVAIAVLIKLLGMWYKDQQKTQSLAREKLEAELKFLKAQIHPHFLFNTLNNLYALTLKKSDQAPEIVLKLSDLLNYMLYECNAAKVPLKKEIEQLQNYIELEKIRYGNRLQVKFIASDPDSYEIAPMLILPFVENSFKHGVSSEIDHAFIEIQLGVKDSVLEFKVSNSKDDSSQKDLQNYKEGIGLKNVKRRLDLLYPGRFELKIYDAFETYTTVLRLNLLEPPANA